MYYSKDVNEIFNTFETGKSGLSEKKAKELLIKNGKNELPKAKEDSIFKIILSQFENPIELILVVTVFLSFIIGETIDAIALIFIISVDVFIGTARILL